MFLFRLITELKPKLDERVESGESRVERISKLKPQMIEKFSMRTNKTLDCPFCQLE